jgi:AraC-like DNA-binding protein
MMPSDDRRLEHARTQAQSGCVHIARCLEDVHVCAPDARGVFHVDSLPDGRASLVIRVMDARGDVSIAGPRTRAHYKRVTGVSRAIVVRFKPGWAPLFFGVPTGALKDRIVALEDVWGRSSRDLCADLAAARTSTEAIDRLARALRTKGDVEPTSAALARRAARLLEDGECRVDRVADRLGVTARHLRRAFIENVGVAPKEFARSVRLQRALTFFGTFSGRATASRAQTMNWARIALDAGYYDQAHLISDFKDLVGLTPSAFVQRACGDTLGA